MSTWMGVFLWKKLLIQRIPRWLLRCFDVGFQGTLFLSQKMWRWQTNAPCLFWWSIQPRAQFSTETGWSSWSMNWKGLQAFQNSFCCRHRNDREWGLSISRSLGRVARFFFVTPHCKAVFLQWKHDDVTRWQEQSLFLCLSWKFFWNI